MEVSKDNVKNIYPLSPTQEGMLFHMLAGDDPEAYVQQIAYRVRGALNSQFFEAAWNELIRRHDILRTAIIHTNGKQPLQVVLKQRNVDFRFEDLAGLAGPEQAARLHEFQQQDRRTPFDAARARLMRVALLRLAPELHEVVWCHHHMISDGWSIGVLQNELVAIYRALVSGTDTSLHAAPPYGRYISYLQSLDAASGAAYWRQYLAGYRAPAAIWATASGGMRVPLEHRCVVPTGLTTGLEALARTAGVTLNTVLQSAWAVLLGRYCGADDVVFGTVVSGRPPQVPGIDRMAGLFVNTVPLRIRTPAALPFHDVMAAVHEDALRRECHQYFPLVQSQMQSELKQNLITCVTAMENYPAERQIQAARDSENLGFAVEQVRVWERTHYDFLIQFLPGPELVINFQFNGAIHRPEAISRLARHFACLLECAKADPSITVAGLGRAIAATPSAPGLSPQATPVHRRVEAQAAAHPDAIAITSGREHITYGELNARANQLAWHLQSAGVTRETRVAICCERSIGLVVSMLAVWKAGGTFVPMDPAYPAERLAYLVEDSEAHLVISDTMPGAISPNGASAAESDNLAIEPEPAQAAYIIYTSGSTGRPKGCVVTQENVSRLFAATEEWFRFGRSDVWTLFHSAAFDFSVWEIWGALAYGGRLVIVPYWVSRSPQDFAALLEAERVTVLNQTPSAFRQLMASGLAGRAPDLALRLVIFGGEALQFQSLASWFDSALAARAQLVNMYGITETTVHVTYRPVTREDVAGAASHIGVPIPDLSLALLDRNGGLVPEGVAGEIHVGGYGVARGYWKRPALTAERFVPDPSGPPGARLYRSGDLARLSTAKDFEYLGRADHQVKIRGFRIEPGEIENAIRGHAGVREVAVIAFDKSEDKQLVAYVAGPRHPEFCDQLREHLTTRLPSYMIPAAFVVLDGLPLTAHGKLDRAALPPPGSAPRKQRSLPRNATEQAMVEVWQQVLGVAQVGIDDSYLELGGDSIAAIRIVSTLLSRQLKIGVRDLFRYPTIAELAPHAGPVTRPQALQRGSVTTAPLSPIQAWFFANHRTDPHWYNHAIFVTLPADADPSVIQKAWQALWNQHDALRLRFVQSGEHWTQQLTASACPSIVCFPAAGLACEVERAQQGFDLATGPLLRLLLFRGARECRLLIVIHHLVTDAFSWHVLLEDFAVAYRQAASGREIVLPAASGSFLEWCAAQPPCQEYPAVAPSCSYGDAAHDTARLSAADTADLLTRASTAYNTVAEDLILAALSRALRDWSGEDQSRILVESHGRPENSPIDVSRTVGWFTSIQPVWLRSGRAGTGDLIRQTKEALRRMPRTGVHPDPAPLRFNYLGNAGARAESSGLAISTQATGRAVSPRARRPVPLDLSAIIIDGQLELSLTYDPARLAARRASELLALHRQALQEMIRHCLGRDAAEVTPSDLTYNELSLEELDRMLL